MSTRRSKGGETRHKQRFHAILVHVGSERHRATYEDLCKVPDHLVAEIIDGQIFTSPRPGLPTRARLR